MESQRKRNPDRRIQRTRSLLHEALVGLLHEKTFDEIAVQDILNRANVGRSIFYMHFRDKDDLLVSGIRDLLDSIRAARFSSLGIGNEKLVWFSLPIYEHIDQHRRGNKLKIGARGRAVLHGQLQRVLVEVISSQIKRELLSVRKGPTKIPADLLVRHLASTFVLVLDWWIERKDSLPPKQVDSVFRALVSPILDES
jgi:AcrR family transcriptional regulator